MNGAFWMGVISAFARKRGDVSESGDPHFANVTLLLHFDGIDGSTSIVDSSSFGHVLSLENGAKISTSQSKFGGASLSPGAAVTGDVAAMRLGTGDFTAEAWIYSTTTSNSVFTLFASSAGMRTQVALYNAGANAGVVVLRGGSAIITTGALITLSSFAHIALVRKSGTFSMYVNGILVGSATPSTTDMTSGTTWVGRTAYLGYLTGYLDDFRLTKGIARYNADFSIPTIAFPDA